MTKFYFEVNFLIYFYFMKEFWKKGLFSQHDRTFQLFQVFYMKNMISSSSLLVDQNMICPKNLFCGYKKKHNTPIPSL